MSESERLVKFNLLGQDYAFYTAASEEEMNTILSLVREQLESIDGSEKARGTIAVSKVAVMACLNLASSYINLRTEHRQYKNHTEAKLGEINDKLDIVFSVEK